MKRTLAAVLLAVPLALTGACSENVSGDSNPDSQVDEAPGFEADEPEEIEPS